MCSDARQQIKEQPFLGLYSLPGLMGLALSGVSLTDKDPSPPFSDDVIGHLATPPGQGEGNGYR